MADARVLLTSSREADALYDELDVKHEPLSLIPPQFEQPLPPLQPAVSLVPSSQSSWFARTALPSHSNFHHFRMAPLYSGSFLSPGNPKRFMCRTPEYKGLSLG